MQYKGFIGPSYQSASYMADNERCVNFYPEPNESASAPSPYCLLPTPGYSTLATTAQAPGRGAFYVLGRYFFVVGFALQEMNLTTYAVTQRGTVASDGNPVTFCSNGAAGHQLGLTSGNTFYVLDLNSNAFSIISLSYGATMCDYLDGYALVLDAATSTLQISALDDFTTFSATQVAQPTASLDWVAMKVCNRLIYLIGTGTGEVWWNAGTAPFPFAPIQEAFMQQGIGAPYSMALLETEGPGTLLWVTQNLQGRGEVVRTNGYTPGRVSTHAIETAVQGYSTIADMLGSAYQENGHQFYVMTAPTGGQTFAYDVNTSLWHERAYWSQSQAQYLPSRALWFAATSTINLALDIQQGMVYQQSTALTTDVDGSVIRRMRQAPRLSNAQQRFTVQKLQVLMDVGQGLVTGQGSDPTMMLSCSRNGGKTFGPEMWTSAGPIGDFETRVFWGPLGQATHFVPRFVMTDPVPWRLVDCDVNLTAGLN